MTEQQTAPAEVSVEEMMESLTGFDEIAIEKAFGGDQLALLTDRPLMGLRALVFVDQRRRGLKDGEAYKAAMELRSSAVGDYFPDVDDDSDFDNPVTAAGKGDEQPE